MIKHYEFVNDDTIQISGHKLTRIRALVDLPQHGVKAGDRGGYIEREYNLIDEAWVADDACVYGNARVCDSALIRDLAHVYENAVVDGGAHVCGYAKIFGTAYISGNVLIHETVQVSGDAGIFDNVRVYGNATISGRVRLRDSVLVSGDACIRGNVVVSGRATIFGTALVETDFDYLTVGPAFSSGRLTTAYRKADNTIEVTTGCFTGTLEEFRREIESKHADNPKYKRQYLGFVSLIEYNFSV